MAIIENVEIERTQPLQGRSEIVVETPDTADSGDTFDIDLSKYGISNLLSIFGNVHSTTGSVLVTEEPVTSVTDGILTVTIGGSVSDKKRVYVIKGK
jgi:hypothetical protein